VQAGGRYENAGDGEGEGEGEGEERSFDFTQDDERGTKCAAPTALGISRLCFPALPGWASFWRADGAQ